MRRYPRLALPGAGRKWLVGVRRTYEAHGFGPLSAELHDGSFVGQCGPLTQDVAGGREIEIICFFARQHWRFGLAEEAARACIRHAFEVLDARRVIALVFVDNRPSVHLALRCGLKFERNVVVDGATILLYAFARTDHISYVS